MKWTAVIAVLAAATLMFLWLRDSNPPPAANRIAATAENARDEGRTSAAPKEDVDTLQAVGVSIDSSGGPRQGDANAILRAEEIQIIQLLAPTGQPITVEAECYLLENNEILHQRMQTFSRLGDYLWGDSIVFEGFSDPATGQLVLDKPTTKAAFLIVFAEGYAPYLQAWQALALGEALEVRLEAVDAIKVRVLDSNGNPIEDSEVWISYGGTFNHSSQADDLTRLRQRFFQFGYLTEKDGTVELLTCFQGAQNEILFIPGEDWGNENFFVESGESFDYVAKRGFTLKGRVTIDGKQPDRETFVKVLDRTNGNFSQLSSALVKEGGHYVVKGILSTATVVDVLGSAADVAIDFIPILRPQSNNVIELDLHLHSGVGGSLLLRTPWGTPIPDTKVTLQQSAELSSPFAYRTDSSGSIELPRTFAKDSSLRMTVFLGSQKYIPITLFRAGDKIHVELSNLATIASLQVGEKVQGEATISNAYWIPESPSITGFVGWNPQDGESPLLGSGPGVLRIALDDGRWLSQRVVLEATRNQAVVVQLAPATVLCDVGTGPATVTLISAESTHAFSASNLSGRLELPCWEGVFSLHVAWENGSLSIPPFVVMGHALDLGRLSPSPTMELRGFVVDEDGQPIANAQLNLSPSFGNSYHQTQSNEQGAFVIQNVPEGHYQLVCTAPSLGSLNSTVTSEATVSHALAPLDLKIILPIHLQATSVTGKTIPGQGGLHSGFLVANGHLQSKGIPPQGDFSFPAPQASAWLGSFHTDGINSSVHALRTPSGPGTYDLSSLPSATFNLRFVDENQRPYHDLLLRLELDGLVMPRRLLLDANGVHTLAVTPGLPWAVSVRPRTGFERRYTLSELSSQPIVIPRIEDSRSIHAIDQDGNSIARFSVQDSSGRLIFSCKAEGSVQVPLSCTADLFASAPGKLGCWLQSTREGETVVLPNAVTGVTVEVSANLQQATTLRWQAETSCDSIWGTEGTDSVVANSSIQLPPLPAGGLKVQVFAADGTVLSSKSWTQVGGQQVLVMSK